MKSEKMMWAGSSLARWVTTQGPHGRRPTNETPKPNVLATVAGVIALCTVLAPGAQARCGSVAGNPAWVQILPGSALARSMDRMASVDDQESPLAAEENHEVVPSIVGFWKTTFLSGDTVVDVGFDQFHSDGMENSVDSPAPVTGNVCLGIWEKTGRRHYAEVHPTFNWDVSSGKVTSIFIQRVEINVSQDGKSFTGTFTWDSYDFKGNPIAGSHVAGTVSGERITVKGTIPFPFPF
jgi:hypothetical protein